MKFTTLMCVGVAAASGAAGADVYVFDWAHGDRGSAGLNMRSGTFESVHAEYDSVSERFLWETTFSDQVTDGYTLAVTQGPNPKGHAGELALIYFDATTTSPTVSIYAYNGLNSQTSYKDGAPLNGTQTPDPIILNDGTGRHPSIIEASVEDTPQGKRVMTLEMDASFVNAHTPMHPGPDGYGEWDGIRFARALGLWMHPIKDLDSSYNEDGSLAHWSGTQGWFDGTNFTTTTVPAPGALALLGLGGAMIARRRR